MGVYGIERLVSNVADCGELSNEGPLDYFFHPWFGNQEQLHPAMFRGKTLYNTIYPYGLSCSISALLRWAHVVLVGVVILNFIVNGDEWQSCDVYDEDCDCDYCDCHLCNY